jgi:hypothetical protein
MSIRRFIPALLVTVLFTGLYSCEKKPAHLELGEEMVDIGSVLMTDEPKAFEVKVRNSGDEDLVISNVETTCNCTTVDYPQEPIKGGRSVTLHLTFSGKEFFPSEMTREVKIYSNSEDSPTLLYFKVKVLSPNVANDSCGTYIQYSHS